MPRKILLSRRDFVREPETLIYGGIWNENAPLSNLLKIQPQIVCEAQSNVDWNSSQFRIDFGYERKNIGLFFFANFRTSQMGTIYIAASNNSDLSSPTYENYVTTWPQDSTAGEDNAWGDWSLNGVYTYDEYVNSGMERYFIPSEPVTARYISVQIFDNTAASPVQIGVFGACEVWESPIDFAPAPQITILDESEINLASFGETYINQRKIRRRFNLGFPALSKDEVLSKTLGLSLRKGKSRPLVCVCYPDETSSLEKTSIYGRISSDNVLSNPFFGHYAQPIQIDQL